MLWLWHYLFGFLVIKINGENIEQLLNNAKSSGLYIWNLTYKKKCITGNISIKDFRKLRYVKRGINCKIKIANKIGLAFYIQKYKNRIGFFIGIFFFVVINIFLSNFIWIINVEGNIEIPKNEIIVSLKEIGIYEGIPKSKIHSKYDSQKLSLKQKNIAWCSLNIEGSVLTVNLSETTISDKEKRKIPSNIKASFDGKIKKINATSGNVLVKVGDVVSKGDLLVSGVTQNMSSILFVHSEGTIIAETKRVFSSEGQYIQSITNETGKVINRYALKIFNIKIPFYLGNIKEMNNYNCKINNITIFNKNIPLKVAHEQYKIIHNKTVTYDKNSLENMLYNNIQKQVESFSFISATEGEKEIIYTDKGILLKINYTCEENIAVQDKILFDTLN